MVSPRIVLKGLGPQLAGLSWETEAALRIGRQDNLDVVLRDNSVDQLHAEVQRRGIRWVLRDLANNPLYPTLVNNHLLTGKEHVLQAQDIVQIGNLLIKVVAAQAGPPPAGGAGEKEDDEDGSKIANGQLSVSGVHMRVTGTTQFSWDQALEAASQKLPVEAAGPDFFLPLLRANQHLLKAEDVHELCQAVLKDAVQSLAAQRGSILLADQTTGMLSLKATFSPTLPLSKSAIKPYSRTLAERCFQRGESIMCSDVEADSSLQVARSIRVGTMSSVICVLLRTPRSRLGILHLDRSPFQDPFSDEDLVLADALAATIAVSIECAQLIEQQRDQFLQTVLTLARAVEMRDQYTGDHTKRVTEYALLLADELGLSRQEKYQLQLGTPLHDIGKIGIDDAILRKPGKLTTSEFDAMKTHTVKGASMLAAMGSMGNLLGIIKHHHERWDGKGYPDGLAGEAIPLNARIVAIADAFDAMTSHRPYRSALTMEQAFQELVAKSGSHFDPTCVNAFMNAKNRVENLYRQSR